MAATMKQAQARCTALRRKGDNKSLKLAREIEAIWKSHPNYESDNAFFLRIQADPFGRRTP